MFVKLLRRAVMIWCVCGFAKAAMWINPFVKVLGIQYWSKPLDTQSDIMWHNINAWLCIVAGIMFVCVAGYGLHILSQWFFNERK